MLPSSPGCCKFAGYHKRDLQGPARHSVVGVSYRSGFETTPQIRCHAAVCAADSQGITKGICKAPCGILCGVCGIVRVLKRPPQIRCRAAVYAADSRGITEGICKPRCGILATMLGFLFGGPFFLIFAIFWGQNRCDQTTAPRAGKKKASG